MESFVRRIQRHNLSRYGRPASRFRRRLRWAWLAVAAWFVWIGFLSDHSLWRIWRLSRESGQAERELARVRGSVAKLEKEADSPAARRLSAEKMLRERDGMARPGEIVYRIQDGAPDTLRR